MGNKLYILGAGPGNIEQITPAVKAAIADSRTVACAARFLHIVDGHPDVIVMTNFNETFNTLRKKLNFGNVALLLSGDTGIFSLLPHIKKIFPAKDMIVLPGISSLQSLCASAAETWQDAVILSGHGRDICETEILTAVEHNHSVVFFCDKDKNPAWLCTLLNNAGLGKVKAFVGEKLGSEDESISEDIASELAKKCFDDLSIVLLINKNYTGLPPLLPKDIDFIRVSNVPMTHEEVRAVIMAKLSLTKKLIVWDLGAGSGSVSVAAAPFCREIHAVEVNSDAAELVRVNCIKSRLHNVKIHEGSALDLMDFLPTPNVVFIGGSGNELSEILKKISSIAPAIRVVVSAVTLKTIAICNQEFSKNEFIDFDAVQIAVSKIKTLGKAQIWQAQNPVVIFSAMTSNERGNEQ